MKQIQYYFYHKRKNHEFGILKFEHRKAQRNPFFSSVEELIQAIVHSVNQLQGKKRIILFIHGYMADFTPVNKAMMDILNEDIFSKQKEAVIIHLQWQGELTYSATQNYVKHVVGPDFASFFSHVIERLGKDVHLSVLVHSMGGYVLQYILEHYNFAQSISNCIMAAPDINAHQFFHSAYFGIQPKNLMILTCNQDKTLALANFLVPYNRLGVSQELIKHEDIAHQEITDFSEEDLLVGKLLKHRYFYTNRKVRALISERLSK